MYRDPLDPTNSLESGGRSNNTNNSGLRLVYIGLFYPELFRLPSLV